MAMQSAPAVWDRTARIRFVLQDLLDHPFYWWPTTLLTYPLEFRQPIELDRLVLTRTDTGETVPISQATRLIFPRALPPSTPEGPAGTCLLLPHRCQASS